MILNYEKHRKINKLFFVTLSLAIIIIIILSGEGGS